LLEPLDLEELFDLLEPLDLEELFDLLEPLDLPGLFELFKPFDLFELFESFKSLYVLFSVSVSAHADKQNTAITENITAIVFFIITLSFSIKNIKF
jgi:hypothetical protein